MQVFLAVVLVEQMLNNRYKKVLQEEMTKKIILFIISSQSLINWLSAWLIKSSFSIVTIQNY